MTPLEITLLVFVVLVCVFILFMFGWNIYKFLREKNDRTNAQLTHRSQAWNRWGEAAQRNNQEARQQEYQRTKEREYLENLLPEPDDDSPVSTNSPRRFHAMFA